MAVNTCGRQVPIHFTILSRLFEERGCAGFCDSKDLFGPDGRLLPLHAMPEDIWRAIASCEIEETYAFDTRPKGKPQVHDEP